MSDGAGSSTRLTRIVNRRQAHRYKLNWPVRFVGWDSSAEGRLRDLSRIGLFAYVGTLLPLDSVVNVSIRLPFRKEIWMDYSAVVVREESKPPAVALRFTSSRPRFRVEDPES
jgi:hypothetical protein